MNTLSHQIHLVKEMPQQRIRGGASKLVLFLLLSAIFVLAGQAGLSTIAHVSQVSIQILVQVCRMSFAALQILGR